MQVYKLPEDYSFMYCQTPFDELCRMHAVSEKRATSFILTSENREGVNYDRLVNIIPAQFCASMSLQISHALQICIQEFGAVFNSMDGIYIQRLPELESGPEILLIIGISFGLDKYAVTPNNFSDRFHKENMGTLLGSFHEELDSQELIH